MANGNKDYPNSGILFKNDRKRDEKDPGYQGSADVTCTHCGGRFQMWLSAWIKEGRKGKFFSLRFKSKEAQQTSGRAAADEDFPF